MSLSLTVRQQPPLVLPAAPVSLAWSLCGGFVRLIGGDGRIRWIDGAAGSRRRTVHVAAACRLAAQRASDSALATDDRTVVIHRERGAGATLLLPAPVRQLAWDSAGLLVLTGNGLGRWVEESAGIRCGGFRAENGFHLMACTGQGLVAVADTQGVVVCLKLTTEIRAAALRAAAAVEALALSSEGNRLVICYGTEARFYAVRDDVVLQEVSILPLPAPATCAEFRRRSGVVAVGSRSGDVVLYRAGMGDACARWSLGSAIRCLAWSANGRRLAAATETALFLLRVCR